MDYKEFALFLAKLKEIGISNKRFADFVGYNASSISCYASGDRKLPKVLGLLVESLRFKMEIVGIDLNKIIK